MITRFRPALLLVLVVFLVSTIPGRAQISISLKRVLLTSQERSREVIISNSGSEAFEVSAKIGLFVVRTDSFGIERFDSVMTSEERRRSCGEWVKIFPKKFRLAANETRKIRLLASPPPDLVDGEYMARLVISTVETRMVRADSVDTTVITASMRFRTNMILQLTYRKGALATGIEFRDAGIIRSDTGTYLLADVHTLGNAVYRGMLSAIIESEEGRRLDSSAVPYIAEISDLRQRLRLKDIPHGRYRLTLESRAELPGSAAELVIPAAAVRRTYELVATASGITLTQRDF